MKLSEDIIYTESYGPQQGDTCVVEWFFRFEFDGKECVSDGVSIAEFNQNGKIVNMREFQSTHDHYSPYKD